jgi:FtsZ-interacting cell division protein ZipA
MNPLLITLTGEDTELSGKKRRPLFSQKLTRRLKKAGKIGAWAVVPAGMATLWAIKKAKAAAKRKKVAKAAAAARQREEQARQEKADAAAAAAENPTPENKATANTASIKAAAATINRQTAEAQEPGEEPASDPGEEPASDPGEEPASEPGDEPEGDPDAETMGDYFGMINPKPKPRAAAPAPAIQTAPARDPVAWIKANKIQAAALAAALAVGIYYTMKSKKQTRKH